MYLKNMTFKFFDEFFCKITKKTAPKKGFNLFCYY